MVALVYVKGILLSYGDNHDHLGYDTQRLEGSG